MKKGRMFLPLLSASTLIMPIVLATSCGVKTTSISNYWEDSGVFYLESKGQRYSDNSWYDFVIDFKDVIDIQTFENPKVKVGACLASSLPPELDGIFSMVRDMKIDGKEIVLNKTTKPLAPGQFKYIWTSDKPIGILEIYPDQIITNTSKITFSARIQCQFIKHWEKGLMFVCNGTKNEDA